VILLRAIRLDLTCSSPDLTVSQTARLRCKPRRVVIV
jgi:hypothetical protein